MHALAMLMMLVKHLSCLIMIFRYLHESLSEPGAKESLHFAITCLSSSLEKGAHWAVGLWTILLRISMLVWRFWAVLKVLCSMSHRLSGDKHSWSLCLMASVVGSCRLLIQLVSSQGPFLLLVISWILSSKYNLLAFLTALLKFFQFSRDLEFL